MRSSSLLAIVGLLLCGCNWTPPWNAAPSVGPVAKKAPVDSSPWAPTGNDDLDTVAVCLFDFAEQGKVTPIADGERKSIVINRLTNGPGYYISDEQIQSETRRMNLPVGIVASLQARNPEQVEVNWIPLGLPFFVSDLSTLPVDLAEMKTAFPAAYPRSFAGVWLWMPGYSEDGMWALVRFTFAPTQNGAIATYLLTKDELGKWRIVNRGLNYLIAPQ